MHFLKAFAFLPFVGLALSSPLLDKRDASTVIKGIENISAATTTLNTSVASYPGGIAGTLDALKILADSYALMDTIICTTNDAKNSANFTNAESESVAQAFINLVPVVESSLSTIEGKKADFEDGLLGFASLTGLVETLLKELKTDSDNLAAAIVDKLTSLWASVAPIIVGEVDSAFEKAISTYA